MDASVDKPVAQMTDDERRALLRRRIPPAARATMQIGGGRAGRRVMQIAGRVLAGLAVAGVFVVAFYHFTASWRVAAGVVGLMLGYMLAIGRMVEGRADRMD